MFLSMNWIGDFVDLTGLDRRSLIRNFTLSTAEVEDIYEKGTDTHGVIAASIITVDPHPNSKKLHLLTVDTGSGILNVVCGAPNVRPGMKVAFAPSGSAVCGKEITTATVGGYTSQGMCCSEAELGISDSNSGLFEITDDIPLGTDLKTVYDIDDIVFEVDNKSLTNRPDLWGHFGIARELATINGRPLTHRYADLFSMRSCGRIRRQRSRTQEAGSRYHPLSSMRRRPLYRRAQRACRPRCAIPPLRLTI